MRFYLDKAVHPITEAHEEQRLKFCRWLLDQPDPEAFVLKAIWTNEFFFCLNEVLYTENDGNLVSY